MMNKILALSVVLFGLLTQPIYATTDANQRLNNFFTTVDTMTGRFIQEVYNENGELTQESEGTVYLNRPGKFRWQYETPLAHEIVSDGTNVWIYDIELEQVTVKSLDNALSSAPVSLLTQKKPVEEQFNVSLVEAEDTGLEWFKLIPLKQDSDFSSLELGVNEEGVREMVLIDQFGHQTLIHLFELQLNTPINGDKFSFTPPEGADVIGEPA